MIKLILSAPVPAMAVAFEHSFQNTENVEIIPGPFETIPEFDCMVSAANSFGLMDGGVDAAITAYFGPQLQGHCCKVSDEAAFCLIQRPYISKTLLTRRIS
ncbi:macro domain-containing protein, partial [Salmonella enterica]|uniref:macro domain-containing protein n=1 Tax=Salmonella enterica TaxID=28901 RepID=UPI001F4DB073